ncbi:MAG: ComF family protein [Propionibacteriaceae bacterium]
MIEPWWSVLSELALGAVCPGCRRIGHGCCSSCIASLRTAPQQVHRKNMGLTSIWSGGLHEKTRRDVLVAYKERGYWSLCDVLGEELARAIAALTLSVTKHSRYALVPIPSSEESIRYRGCDTTLMLAKSANLFLRQYGLETQVKPCLRQYKGGRDQVGLSAQQRRENLQGRIVIAKQLPNFPMVIIDDVITTGASIAAGCKVVTQAGGAVLGAATFSARGWT